jgi:malonyl-CoA O-methyltransferase
VSESTNPRPGHAYRVIPGFERAAGSYDDYAVLQRKVADEMLDRLHEVNIKPGFVIDVGCGTGYCTRRLHKIWSSAQILGIDLAKGMVHQASGQKGWFSKQAYCQADAVSLPLKDGCLCRISTCAEQ